MVSTGGGVLRHSRGLSIGSSSLLHLLLDELLFEDLVNLLGRHAD